MLHLVDTSIISILLILGPGYHTILLGQDITNGGDESFVLWLSDDRDRGGVHMRNDEINIGMSVGDMWGRAGCQG